MELLAAALEWEMIGCWVLRCCTWVFIWNFFGIGWWAEACVVVVVSGEHWKRGADGNLLGLETCKDNMLAGSHMYLHEEVSIVESHRPISLIT